MLKQLNIRRLWPVLRPAETVCGKTTSRRACDNREWRRDPLSHPDVARMSQRELADLPFQSYWVFPDERGQ